MKWESIPAAGEGHHVGDENDGVNWVKPNTPAVGAGSADTSEPVANAGKSMLDPRDAQSTLFYPLPVGGTNWNKTLFGPALPPTHLSAGNPPFKRNVTCRPFYSETKMAQEKPMVLVASYSSPANDAFETKRTIPAPPSDAVSDKTIYLEALRKAVAETQGQVNKELTARMEEDKARDAAADNPVDDDKEEQNYGEEVQEED
ncbi:Gon7 family protein [Drechmeria coniospora]|uniref:EKC/KEOPS complex subunit GON7 n=1 Tax=Drechmeria coniospora TaxID=98403 RepID=A0A151GMU3_DRECN|nr:Gon7 family protein [Drechmeria coniospora]KYK58444.1 Gon7 family protein [Drechmeria coniospora]